MSLSYLLLMSIYKTTFSSIYFSFNSYFIHSFIYLFLEEKGEREGEKHLCVVASHTPPARDLAHNPSKCPDWESYPWPFASQAGTQSPEPHHRPGLFLIFNVRVALLALLLRPSKASFWKSSTSFVITDSQLLSVICGCLGLRRWV